MQLNFTLSGVAAVINCSVSSVVRSFGTEDRPAPKHIPPRNETYEFIIFRGSDIKDLHVSGMFGRPDEAPPDPAILSVSSVSNSAEYCFINCFLLLTNNH